MSIPVSDVRDYFLDLQQRIVSRLELSDGKKFHTDQWDRDEGGWHLTLPGRWEYF